MYTISLNMGGGPIRYGKTAKFPDWTLYVFRVTIPNDDVSILNDNKLRSILRGLDPYKCLLRAIKSRGPLDLIDRHIEECVDEAFPHDHVSSVEDVFNNFFRSAKCFQFLITLTRFLLSEDEDNESPLSDEEDKNGEE
jgi:hypothetical protein